jgi:hypothetical protein
MSVRAPTRSLSRFTLFDRLFSLWERVAQLIGHKKLRTKWEVRLGMEAMEERLVPDGRPLPLPVIFAGAGLGHIPVVKAYNAETGDLNYERTVFDPSFLGGVRVAVGDFTRDGLPDVVAGAGPGGGPEVRILDGKTGEQIPGPLGSFWAYDPMFAGGIHVAAADVDGDRVPDVITAAGLGGGPHVRVFNGKTGTVIADFFAFDPDFHGGITVAAADVTGDGKAEVAVGAGIGGGPRVKVYDIATGAPIAGPLGSFFAFDASDRGGVSIGADGLAGDVNADGVLDLAVGVGATNAPRVKVFSGKTGEVLQDIAPFGPAAAGGVRVAVAYVDDDSYADIVTGSGPGVPAQIQVFSGKTGLQLPAPMGEYTPFGSGLDSLGGVFVASSNDPVEVTPAFDMGGLDEDWGGTYLSFNRTAPYDDPLVVNYTISGTATGGVDYTGLSSGTVTIPAGEPAAFIEFSFIDDLDIEGDETIIATLTSGSGYVPGDPATQIIFDNDFPSPTTTERSCLASPRQTGAADRSLSW